MEVGEVKFTSMQQSSRNKSVYGICMCVRGSLGEFIKAKITWFFELPQPHETEVRGLKEVIKLLDCMSLSKVSIELDCKQMVHYITRRLNINSTFGAINDICKTSLRIYQNFKLGFIRKQANSVCHLLARTSLSYTSSHIHDYMPSCIDTVLMNEMS